jgi:phage terminase small subunit
LAGVEEFLMTDKQQLFLNAYLANGSNATKAAITAGYSQKTAYSQGQRLLKNVEIQKALSGRIEEAVITADEVLRDVKSIAKGAKRDQDRLKGYELLGKHLKLWTDKTELTGKDGGPIETATRVIEPGE